MPNPSPRHLAAFEQQRASLASDLIGTVEDFEPLWDYLLVRLIEREQVTPGGLHMPENYAPKLELKRAKVVKAGKGAYRESGAFIPNPIKEGSIIYMMGHTAPFEVFIKVEGKSERHLLLAGRDCVAVERTNAQSNEQAEPGKGN